MPDSKTIGLWVSAAVLMGWQSLPAGAQAPAPANVQIVHRTNCIGAGPCDVLVNNSKTDRAVATVVVSMTNSDFAMDDFERNSFPLRSPSTQIVLLYPGQEIQLKASIEVQPGDLRPFTYAIAGSYVPRPDLMDLPTGRARDLVRIRQMVIPSQFPGVCPLGPSQALTARNNSIWRWVAVTFRNKTPGRRTSPQTLYLGPGEDGPVGCANEWENIEFISADFIR